MKKILFFVLALIITASTAPQVDQNPKQFETTFTITYNSITLERATELEKIIKKKFDDACKIDVELKDVANQVIYYPINNYFINDTYTMPKTKSK